VSAIAAKLKQVPRPVRAEDQVASRILVDHFHKQ